MDRLRELRGPDTRERDLANLLGFEHSRAVRWKEGQMYVDRAEYLVRLSDALDVETMALVALAAGTIGAEQATKQISRALRPVPMEGKRPTRPLPTLSKLEAAETSTDATQFALDPVRFEAATRGVVLLVSSAGEGRTELAGVLGRHVDVGGLVAPSFSTGVCLAERHRPELVLLDMGLANVHAFDACRALAGLTSRAGRRCRVVAGTSALTDAVEKPALMAGAATVTLFPFGATVIESELDRLEERLGPRKPNTKARHA
jgi:hypothetical protein